MSRHILNGIVFLCVVTASASAAPPVTVDSPNETISGNFGRSVAIIRGLSDVDADTVADDGLIVGAYAELSGSGRVYVFDRDGSLVRQHDGSGNEQLGYSVAAGGDFDGDGATDYIVGSPSASGGGRAVVYSGPTGAVLATIAGTGNLGWSVTFVGPIPGLGTGDAVAAGDFSAASVVVAGYVSGGPPATTTLSGSGGFGYSVAGIGDFNGDGYPDLAVGSPLLSSGQGQANVYSGFDFSSLITVSGTSGSQAGFAVGSAGNFDGTGNVDLAVGFGSDDAAASNAGAVEIWAHTGTRLLRLEGAYPNNGFGKSLAPVGDVDGDGDDDLLVGAPGPSTPSFPGGEAYIVSGAAAQPTPQVLPARTIFQLSPNLVPPADGDSVGFAAAGGGDLDGDGRDDWAVGSPSRDGSAIGGAGQVFLSLVEDEFPSLDPPSNVAVTSPAPGALLTGAGIPFTATADDADQVEFFVDGALAATDTVAPFGTTLDSLTYADGDRDLTVLATNGAGSTASSVVTVEIDNSSPVLAITHPADGAIIGGTVDFTATAADPNGVASVTFDAGATLSYIDFVDPYATTYDTTLEAGDGPVTMTITGEDGLGNSGAESIVVVIDNTDPLISITGHADGDFVAGSITVIAAASDTHLEQVEFFVGGVSAGVVTDFTNPPSIGFDTTTVPDGSLSLEAVATDAAGNSTAAITVTVEVDNTLPTEMLRRPADGRRVRNNVNISVDASDSGSGVAHVLVTAAGQTVIDSTDSVVSGTFDSRTVLDGDLVITCTVTDGAGNQAVESVTVTVRNLNQRLRPRRLNLNSNGSQDVELRMSGGSVDLLAPVANHVIQLQLPDGSQVTATGGSSVPDNNRVTAFFDRVDLISTINAYFATLSDPPNRLELRVIVDGKDTGFARLRVRE